MKSGESAEAAAGRTISPGAYEGQYTGSDEEVARAWISEVTGEKLEGPLQECLKSGVVLCKLVNRIKSNSILRINTGPMPFPQRENVNAFCEAARSMGVPDKDNFTTADLFDNRNFKQVLVCIFSFGRQCYFAPGWNGPCLGRPEMAKLGPSRSFGRNDSK
ncbi:hypothetical protein GUITHDRAFT_152375 [Guillardia theta CCMP2712]|uniref:Calponin-homology (CH) domain-containing protein n=1 Tax=Guillardia theta (strain CCMP2712) TaxID=905079 RepID=L1JDV0_GUITC|nr:hypothetical protein GUITHDRAFT_152375 [Guillardia theta CCMP2712]EKX46492.1 hypothetical protein GUITHDRAFT_152375 [Guillardia theta CCMP2712]|eukprot:XP_005833472.1 hypothetical protein GUITHDRAFT_152375 [Guillardia theta CCMP2712]